jgi:hypothetical protein
MLVRATVVAAFLFLFVGGVLSTTASADGGSAVPVQAGALTTPAGAGEDSAEPVANPGKSSEKSEPTGNGEKDEKSGAEKLESRLKTWLAIAGLLIGAVLVVIAVGVAIVFLIMRWKPSLAIESFADGGVDAKVGGVVTSLVQRRLSELSVRKKQSTGPYKLDVVVADVELLAESENLEKALGGVSEASQLKLVIALLSLADRVSAKRLTATGELVPPGEGGHGIVLSLQSGRKGVVANGAVWGGPTKRKADAGDSGKPTPYYDLADRVAGWIQYQAGCTLSADVELMTTSADSFSLLSEGLVEQRAKRMGKAAGLYAKALDADPENIAALINLSAIVARYYGEYGWAVNLLGLARTALKKRYEEPA